MISNKFREDIGKLYNIPELQKKEVDTPMKKSGMMMQVIIVLTIAADDFKTTKNQVWIWLPNRSQIRLIWIWGWERTVKKSRFTIKTKII